MRPIFRLIYLLKKSLKQADAYASPVQFTLKKNRAFKTACGGFLTLLALSVFFAIGYQSFVDFVTMANLTIYTIDVYDFNPAFIDLNPSNMNWAVSFSTPAYNYANYFNITAYYGINTRDSLGNQVINHIPMGTEPCTSDHFLPELLPSFSLISPNLSMLVCPMKNLTFPIQGKYTSSLFTYFFIRLQKCQNGTSVICKSPEEVQNTFSDTFNSQFLNFYIRNNLINPSDLNETIIPYLDDRIFETVDLTTFHADSFYLTKNTVYSDFNLVFEDYQEEYETYAFEGDSQLTSRALLPSEIASPNTGYINLYIGSNFISQESMRSCQKIRTVLGYLGGLWSILFFAFSLLGVKYNEYRKNLKIANSLYQFNNPKGFFDTSVLESNVGSSDLMIKKPPKTKSRKNCKEVQISNLCQSKTLSENIKDVIKANKYVKLSTKTKYLLPKFLVGNSKNRRKYSIQKIFRKKAKGILENDIDIVNLLQQVREIGKIKEILLDENQRKLFELLPKTRINLNEQIFGQMSWKSKKINQELKEYKNLYESFVKVKDDVNPANQNINQRILKGCDPKLIEILEKEFKKN